MTKTLSRRIVLIGAGALSMVLAGCSRHKPTAYDDLLKRLEDRDEAARIGQAVLAEKGEIDVTAVTASLREKLKHGSLADVAAKDAAAGRVIEGRGWVLPETVALLCALAAKAAA